MSAISVGTLEAALTLKDQLNAQADAAFKRFRATAEQQVAQITSITERQAKKLEETGQRLSSIGGTLSAAVTLPLIAVGAAASKTSVELNESLANISSLLTDIDGSQLDAVIDGMKGGIQGLAHDVGKSTKDISNGLYEVISSLGYTDDSFGQLEISAKAARAGLSSTQEAFNFLSSVTKSYGDTSETAFKKAADLGFQAVNLGQTTFPQLAASIGGVAPLAKLAEVSMEEMFAVIATNTGVTGNTSEVVTQMGSALTALMSPSERMTELYRKLNVASGEALIAEKGFGGALQEVAKYARETGIPLTDLLGRKEAVILTASLAGAQEARFASNLEAMGKAAASNGQIVEFAFKKQTDGVNKAGFAWEQFKVQVEVALQKVGDSLVPVLVRAANALRPLLNLVITLADWFSKVPKPIQIILIALAGLAAAVGPVLFVVGNLISAFGQIVLVAPQVKAAIIGINTALAGVGIAAVAAGIAIGMVIDQWRKASEARMAYEINSANLEGRALAYTRAVAVSGGTVTKGIYEQAKADLADLEKQITDSKKRIKEAVPDVGAGSIVTVDGKTVEEEKRNLELLTMSYGRLKESIGKSKVVTEEQAAAMAAAGKTGSAAIYTLTGDAKALADSLSRSTAQTNELNAALKRGASDSEIAGIKRRHALENQYLQDVSEYGADAALALKSFRTAEYDASAATTLLTSKVGGLSKELATLVQGLARSISLNKQLATIFNRGPKSSGFLSPGADASEETTRREVEAARRAYELQTQYLEDVERFGKRAAEGLRAYRREQYDSAQAATKAEQAYEGVISALKAIAETTGDVFIKQISADIKRGADQMRQDAQDMIRKLDLKRELEDELEFQLTISAVDESSFGLQQAKESYIAFLRDIGQGSVAHGEQVIAAMDLVIVGYSRRIKEALQSLADIEIVDRVNASQVTAADIYRKERADIERIMNDSSGKVKISWKAGLDYIAKITAEHWMSQLQGWQTLFSFFGEMFGGAVQQIAQALGNIQSAYDTGKKLDASGFGGGMSGSWGYMLATIQVMYEIYRAVDAMIERHKARKWSEMTSVSVTGGDWSSPSYFEQNGREMSTQLRKMVESITDILGGFLLELPKISIKARKDGKEFSAYVAGIFVGTFADAQTAMEEAVATAIQQATFVGLSAELVQALQASIGASMDELRDNIETARFARQSRVGDAGARYLDVSDRYRQQIEAERRLGLAIDHTVAARRRELDALVYSALGIDTSTSDVLRDLRSLSDGITEAAGSMRASTEHQIQDIIDQIADLERRRGLPGGGSGVGPGSGPGGNGGGRQTGGGDDTGGGRITKEVDEWEEAIRRLQEQLEEARRQLAAIPESLSDLQINMGIFNALYKYLEGNVKYAQQAHDYALMKVEIEFELIRQQLIAFGKFDQFAEMFNDALAAAREQAGEEAKPPRGGRGRNDTATDFITGRRFELATRGLTEFQRSIAEVMREYDEQIAQNTRRRAELVALRNEEIALMERERRQAVILDFNSFVNPANQFDEIRNNAQGLIDVINDSPFGDARRARMIGRVMEELNEQLDALVMESAVGLMGDLLSDLEKYGISQSQQSQMRNALAVLEHNIKIAHYRTEIEILRAQGRLAPEIMAKIDEAFGLLMSIDPTRIFVPPANDNWRQTPGGYYVGNREDMNSSEGATGNDREDAILKATEALNRYRLQLQDDLSQALAKINDDFDEISSALGRTPDVVDTWNRAIAAAIADFVKPVKDTQRDIFFAAESSRTTEEQWARIQSDLIEAQNKFRAGDLSIVKGIPDLAKTYIEVARRMFPHGAQSLEGFETGLDAFLTEVGNLNVDTAMGSAASPMYMAGMEGLMSTNENQLDQLVTITRLSERTVTLLEKIASIDPWNSMERVA